MKPKTWLIGVGVLCAVLVGVMLYRAYGKKSDSMSNLPPVTNDTSQTDPQPQRPINNQPVVTTNKSQQQAGMKQPRVIAAQAQGKVVFQTDEQVRKEQLAAVDEIRSNLGGEISALWNKETGTPGYLTGGLTAQGFKKKTETPEKATFRFLLENQSIFRLNSPNDELILMDTKTDEFGMTHLLFNRIYKGLKVLGSQVAVHIDADGKIATVNGTYHPSFEMSVTPSISNVKALEISKHDLGTNAVKDPKTELIIFSRENEVRLAWIVNTPTMEYPSMSYIVDARTGEILMKNTGIVF